MVYDFTLVCLQLYIIVAFSRSSDSVNYLGFQISDEKTPIIQISDNYPIFFYELIPVLTFQINSGNMPSVLSVIAIIAVVSAAAFVFAFILVPSGGASRLTSTEKRYKAAVPRWNAFAAEEGILTGEDNFPSLVDQDGKPTKEGNRLMQRFAVHLDGASDMTYNIWIVCLN